MNTIKLHYIYDPLCGWCYAAAPLIQAVRQIADVPIELHAGGLWVDSQVKRITPELREYLMPHDERIAQISGQTFGEAYQNGLLSNTQAVLDSEPPIRAILTAQTLSEKGLDYLHALQIAHFVEGREISRFDTLSDIAAALGLAHDDFERTFEQTDVQAHLHSTRQWMSAWQIQGFPNFLLQHNEQWLRIAHSDFYGRPQAFAQQLRAVLNQAAAGST